MKNNRRNSTPVATNLHDVESGIEGTERHADWIHQRIGIDPCLSRPGERTVVIEHDYRFIIALRRAAVEKRKGCRGMRRGIESCAGAIVQTLERLRQRSLERAERAFGGFCAVTLIPGRAARGARNCWSSDPDRDEKERDCGEREDCAPSQTPASYILTTD